MLFSACDSCNSTAVLAPEDAPLQCCPACGASLRAVSREEGLSRLRPRLVLELSERSDTLRAGGARLCAESEDLRKQSKELGFGS
jgi:hypothetical protein